jgi:hypothetical protein
MDLLLLLLIFRVGNWIWGFFFFGLGKLRFRDEEGGREGVKVNGGIRET